MTDPTVTISEATKDNRPEPPPMPDLWVVRSWVWQPDSKEIVGCKLVEVPKWVPGLSMFPHKSERDANFAADCLTQKGHRRVQVIKIGGDK